MRMLRGLKAFFSRGHGCRWCRDEGCYFCVEATRPAWGDPVGDVIEHVRVIAAIPAQTVHTAVRVAQDWVPGAIYGSI